MAKVTLNNLPFFDWENQSSSANKALGRFITVWVQVETMCGFLFKELTKMPPDTAMVVFDRIGTREQIEILRNLDDQILENKVKDEFVSAIKEVFDFSEKRNRVTHAHWGLYNNERARFWHGITPEHFNEIVGDTPSGIERRAESVFTLTDLGIITAKLLALRFRLELIHSEIVVRKLTTQSNLGGAPPLP